MSRQNIGERQVPDNIIARLTGHKGRELERYKHLRPDLRQQTTELIARVLEQSGIHPPYSEPMPDGKTLERSSQVVERNGGDDGARTRDLRRDRPAF